ESGDGDEKRGGAIAQDKLQSPAIERDDGIESILGLAIKPALLFLFLVAEKLGAHHGRERERDDGGDENGDRQGDSKFSEKPADDIAHEKKRNENSDERDGE